MSLIMTQTFRVYLLQVSFVQAASESYNKLQTEWTSIDLDLRIENSFHFTWTYSCTPVVKNIGHYLSICNPRLNGPKVHDNIH